MEFKCNKRRRSAMPASRADPRPRPADIPWYLSGPMGIVHIVAPASIPAQQFTAGPAPAAVGASPVPRLATCEAYESPTGAVSTGTWEASPGVFRRAIMDSEVSHFLAGHATFVTDAGQSFEFRAGDTAYFPPFSRGVWTVHETLRKTYCIWK
jgi:uncharacterized protein